jgi:hypothetical protein
MSRAFDLAFSGLFLAATLAAMSASALAQTEGGPPPKPKVEKEPPKAQGQTALTPASEKQEASKDAEPRGGSAVGSHGAAPALQGADKRASQSVLYEIEYPSGVKGGPSIAHGQNLPFPEGSRLRLFCDCKASLDNIQFKGQDTISTWTSIQKKLPVVLVSGGHGGIGGEGSAVVEWLVEEGNGKQKKGTLSVDGTRAESPWTIGDSVAYAVTRTTGNTAIAGVGLFINLPGFTRIPARLLRYAFMVHLLPPQESGGAADLGIAPLGVSFLGNRLVLGIGWDVSRYGTRPTRNNMYFYVGISASNLLRPTPSQP